MSKLGRFLKKVFPVIVLVYLDMRIWLSRENCVRLVAIFDWNSSCHVTCRDAWRRNGSMRAVR